jgi:hypothetical protein
LRWTVVAVAQAADDDALSDRLNMTGVGLGMINRPR